MTSSAHRVTRNQERNDMIDHHVLAAIRDGATRAASIRKALASPLETAGVWSSAWRRGPFGEAPCDPRHPRQGPGVAEGQEAARRELDVDRSLRRLRGRWLIRYCCPNWEVTS